MSTNRRILAFALKGFLTLLGIILVLGNISIQRLDRKPYQKQPFYPAMISRIDSLSEKLLTPETNAVLMAGSSKVNITPALPIPMAGYGARDPKGADAIHDSSFVRTLVLKSGQNRVAIVSADLLIIHPELAKAVYQSIGTHWKPEEIYFCATHTHSGPGGWAPGIVGELFAGKYDPKVVEFLAGRITRSIELAEIDLDTAAIAFGEMRVDDLVLNRLVKEKGIVDPWFKSLWINKNEELGAILAYSAHATCFGQQHHELTGDYPAYLQNGILADSLLDFTVFTAGAVGSMGPVYDSLSDGQQANEMAAELAQQLKFYQMLAYYDWQQPTPQSFKINLDLPRPQFKISQNLALRPWLFEWAFGNYPHHISGIKLGQTLFLGLPGDFSGELAVQLYEHARSKGVNLVITSFNGDYTGYIIRDNWYDLPKYEARTMSWYGPDAGSYFSEIVTRIIDELYEHH